ncbi:hypothetical protein ACIA48_02170 [Mycobacterium sp. NPDC051804]|uniref:hypothetical protein n=1 Tax=Mycobacterium sp. NPDC051804 TaxID=3364295 RepID=UPI0037B495B3
MFDYLLALNQVQGAILKVPVNGDDPVSVLLSGLGHMPDGIVVDPHHRNIYWTNMGAPTVADANAPLTEENLDFYGKDGSLERAAIDGTQRTYLLPPGSFVTGKQLAGAWSSGRLYWSDREGASIRSVRLDGSDQRDEVVVATNDADCRLPANQCVGIAVDEHNGLLYWTQKGAPKGGEGRILRTSLTIPDGQTAADRDIEVLWSGLPEPVDVELDRVDGVIFWTDRGAAPAGNTLNRATVPGLGEGGGEITILAGGFGEAIGLAVDKDAGVAYVSDLEGRIRAVELDGSGHRIVIATDGNLTGIAGV